jgi:pilus assembly protein Flp/PilA
MAMLKNICDAGWRFCAEEDGPTAVEYAVLLAFIIAVCVGSVNALATRLGENFDKSADAIVGAGQ